MKTEYSQSWKSSIQPRKQRKYLYNAPLHTQISFFGVHLSKDLKKKYSRRSVTVREGDTVKVIRGQHKGKTGKIRNVDRKNRQVSIEGVETTRRDGSKALIPIHPSNLIMIDLDLTDKKRKLTEAEKKTEKKTAKKEKK